MIPYKVAIFLHQDVIDYLDRLAHALAKKTGREATRSEAVAWLVKRHRKKVEGRKEGDFKKSLPSVILPQ